MRKKIWYSIFAIAFLLASLFALKQYHGYLEYIPQPSYETLYSNNESLWQPRYSPFSSNDSLYADSILNKVIQCSPNDASQMKHEKISKYVVQTMRNLPGDPPSWLFDLSPSEQLEEIVLGRTEVFCTQYSLIYAYLARCAGLTVRRIESIGKNDHHAIQETYDRERKCWIYSDLLHNVLSVSENNQNRNMVDMLQQLWKGETQRLTILQVDSGGNLLQQPYTVYQEAAAYEFDPDVILHFYHEHNLDEVYSTKQQIMRLLTHENWFERYAQKSIPNTLAWLKYVWFALILVVMMTLARYIFQILSSSIFRKKERA